MKVAELRKILKRTGASIIEIDDVSTTVPRHQFRLCTRGEILSAVADTMKAFLVDAYGNEYKPLPKESKFSSVILGSEYFDDKADIKVRFSRKKILVCSCEDPGPDARTSRRFKLRVAVFGEVPDWGPRRIWKEADSDNDELPF